VPVCSPQVPHELIFKYALITCRFICIVLLLPS
jgi:hypothetical protein